MTPLAADVALDQFFLEARCQLLTLAAILDRIDRGSGADKANSDPRTQRIHAAVALLSSGNLDRAAQIQRLFSLEYDPEWKRPQPR